MSLQLKPKPTETERIYTNREFEALPEFEERYELLNGRIVKKEMAGDEHGRIVETLSDELAFWGANKIGRKWRDTTFDLAEGWQPVPDLAYVVADRVPTKTKKSVKVVPDLVVEVHSPSDLENKNKREAAAEKIKKYQAVGVKVVWAINPDKQMVEVYLPDQPEPVQTLGIGEILEAPDIIPGFRLPIAVLFED